MKKLDYEKAALDLGLKLCPNEEIKVGDWYLAGRNTHVQLLTAKYIHPKNWIVPVESAYSYDIWECVKVIEN